MKDENFKIKVGENTYTVEPESKGGHYYRFKISTDCEYIMTVKADEHGVWQAEKDVTVLDERFVDAIGEAIEKHNVLNKSKTVS
jgi:hypothetical protein